MITNNSLHLPIWLKYNKVPYVFIDPITFKVKASNSLEIVIIFKPAKLGAINTKIVFDLLYKHEFEENYQDVGKLDVPLKLYVQSVTKKPIPRFVMGITPMCTNEVGFLTEDVRFNSDLEKPSGAMIRYRSNPVDDDLIAFPNDRPLTLKPWRNDIK